MNLSRPFVLRPVATTLLTLGVALSGLLAGRALPVSPLPQIEFPTIDVRASLPGASPEIMASSVATPLERSLGRIASVTELTSASVLGSTDVTLQFSLDRDIDGAARDVQAAINAARSYLPSNLPTSPTWRKTNPADAPILILALTSDLYEPGTLYDEASTVLVQRISQIEGVGEVDVGGSSLPAVRVEMNPRQLDHYGLGVEAVETLLRAQNAYLAKGQLSDSTRTFEILANDQLSRAEQYRPLVVGYSNGAAIRLSDVAEVTDSVQDLRSAGFVDGKPGVVLIIRRQPGANIIDTVDRVVAAVPELQSMLPAAVDLAVMMDRSTTIRASVSDIERTLLVSIALVVGVVFLFLRDVRATLVPAVVVPVSLLGTLSIMYLCGYSLDNLSLMALTVSTGFVVDDAIVVMENVARHLRTEQDPLRAALLGAEEIGFTVMSISVSLVAVFIPILLMGGLVGRLFREFAVTLSVATLVSMVVSLTTTPMMSARLLRPEPPIEQQPRWYRWSEDAFDRVLAGYRRALAFGLDHARWVLAALILVVAINVGAIAVMPKGFFPQQDNGLLIGGALGSQDISFRQMSSLLLEYARRIGADPAVDHVVAFTGGLGAANTGFVFASLKPADERKVDASTVIDRLRPQVVSQPGAVVFLQAGQDLRIGGRLSRAQYQYTILSDRLSDMMTTGPALLERMRALPGFRDVSSDQQNSGLQATITYDRTAAARLGLSPAAIDRVLYNSFGQAQVSTIYTPLNQYRVVLEVAPEFWQSPETLDVVHVPGASGSVPLGAFSNVEMTAAPLQVNHQGQYPSVTVSFNLAPGLSLSDAAREVESGLQLPQGVRGTFSGTLLAFQESLANEPVLILTAILAVYIVLGILYESWVHPITILSTIPSAGVGAVLALALFRLDLDVIGIIGMILLIGIVKKNAILMIDFALVAERDEGKSTRDAIFETAVLRFRPILMTTMAAMLGALPLALGTGPGSELRRPLGITIVGGLLFSQLLTLFTTPVVYLYLDRLRRWWEGAK